MHSYHHRVRHQRRQNNRGWLHLFNYTAKRGKTSNLAATNSKCTVSFRQIPQLPTVSTSDAAKAVTRMAARLALLLLGAACISCVFAQTEEIRDDKKRCDRLLPVMPWRGNYRLNCKYLCKGWPFRTENEEDGIPCGPLNLLGRVCKDGKCVKEGSRPGTESPAEFTTTVEETSTEEHETKDGPGTTEEPEIRSTADSTQKSWPIF